MTERDTQAIAARLTAIAERLDRLEQLTGQSTEHGDVRWILAHVETLTQQVAELTEQREQYHDDAVHFASLNTKAEQENARLTADIKGWLKMLYESDANLEQAEQQRDAAHAALRAIKEKATFVYRHPTLEAIVTLADAALAASAPQKLTCRQCGQVAVEHCDLDEPGVDHQIGCDKMHHEFAPAPAQETERGR